MKITKERKYNIELTEDEVNAFNKFSAHLSENMLREIKEQYGLPFDVDDINTIFFQLYNGTK